MSGPAFQQVEKLFHVALALTPDERAAFLEKECGGNVELRAAVEDLLRHDHREQTETFLASPVAHAAARLRADVPTQADNDQGNARAPQSMPEIPGYEILAEVGRGGMGVVYEARQISLNRLVALKMLRPDSAAGPQTLDRFRIEAETLARLQHPNIIAIHDIGTAEGRPFFSMEYVAGGSLAQVLDGRPQDIAGSARIMEILARTMADVHRHGIVHRDLKPANILLLSTESTDSSLGTRYSVLSTLVPKISDFGLAKVRSTGKRLTESGMVMGTLCYMAPEQARSAGRAVGPATDQFALGAMLYEMLTGRPPFDAPTAAETITQLLHDEPLSPQRLRPKVPRDLATICLKCLEKSPRSRYASCLELATDLRRFQASEPILARPVGPVGRLLRWCRRRPLVAASLFLSGLLALVLLITVLVYEARLEQALTRAEGTVEFEREQIVEVNVKIGLAELEHADAFAALLRFTEALRLDEGPPEREREHRLRIATTLRQCPRLAQLYMYRQRILCTRLEANGGWLAVIGDDHRVQIHEALTGRSAGPALKVPESVMSASVSHDGRSLLTVSNNGPARLWDVGAGTFAELPCKEEQAITEVLSHPDHLLLLSRHADSTIRLWNLTKRPLALPPPLSGGPVLAAAVNDGTRWLFTVDKKHAGQLWDVAAGSPEGKPVMLGQAVSLAAVSPAGRRVAVLGSDKALRIWDVSAGKWLANPMRSAQTIHQITFAPDEARVLVSLGAAPPSPYPLPPVPGGEGRVRGAGPLLQIWRPESTELVTVLAQLRAGTGAQFSSDGRLVIARDEAGAARVWDAATGRALTPPLRHGRPLAAAEISADGRQVVTVGQDGTVATWLLPSLADTTSGESIKDTVPDVRPVAELVALAQLLACGWIDDKQQRQDLSAEALWSAWQRITGHPG